MDSLRNSAQNEQFFSSAQVSQITCCSLRQLQYWREQAVLVPTVSIGGRGNTNYYNYHDLICAKVMGTLRRIGFDYPTSAHILGLLGDLTPDLSLPSSSLRYYVLIRPGATPIVIPWLELGLEVELSIGTTIAPVWIDQIKAQIQSQIQSQQ